MERDIQEILISEEQIKAKIEELGEILTREYEGKNPVIVGVLKGVVVFYADMVRKINTPCQMDFMWISSYSGTESTGKMVVRKDVSADIKGRHVLILEDIFDTGNSLEFTVKHLMANLQYLIWVLLSAARKRCRNLACYVQIGQEVLTESLFSSYLHTRLGLLLAIVA